MPAASPEARGVEGQHEHALIVRPRVRRDGAGSGDDARQRLDEQAEREALDAAERLHQAVAHPRLRHRPARVLEHSHLAVRRHTRREVDHEVRRPRSRDAGCERVRGQPRLPGARRCDALLRPGVVREQQHRHAVTAGAIGVVGQAPRSAQTAALPPPPPRARAPAAPPGRPPACRRPDRARAGRPASVSSPRHARSVPARRARSCRCASCSSTAATGAGRDRDVPRPRRVRAARRRARHPRRSRPCARRRRGRSAWPQPR